MNIKLILLAALVLCGNLTYAMRDGYMGLTPQEFVSMHTNKQTAKEKNKAVLEHIANEPQRLALEKKRLLALPEFNPSSQDTMCTICRDSQKDEIEKLPWTKLLDCKHEFHIGCISQYGAEAEETIASQCPNCRKAYTLSQNVNYFLSNNLNKTLTERAILSTVVPESSFYDKYIAMDNKQTFVLLWCIFDHISMIEITNNIMVISPVFRIIYASLPALGFYIAVRHILKLQEPIHTVTTFKIFSCNMLYALLRSPETRTFMSEILKKLLLKRNVRN